MASDDYWFPAKRFGWGWGMPRTWQGSVVLAAYAAVIGLLVYYVPPQAQPMEFAFGCVLSTCVLLLVCWLKGEPPRWRWGGR
jgi:hypothetical protein